MPVTTIKYLLDDDDDSSDDMYDWDAAFREIGRYTRQGLDAIWGLFHSIVLFVMQLPEMFMNTLAKVDFEKVKQDLGGGVHIVIQYLIEHELLVATAFFVFSLILGFPIGSIMKTIFLIPHMMLLGILGCLGFRRTGVEQNSLAASYQSRNYGAFTPSYQSRAVAIGTRHPVSSVGNFWVMLLSWLFMTASVILVVHSFWSPTIVL